MEQIIPKKPISVEHNWQKELASSFTDPAKLLQHLGLDQEKYAQHIKARRLFPMRVPRHFVDLMEKENHSLLFVHMLFKAGLPAHLIGNTLRATSYGPKT